MGWWFLALMLVLVPWHTRNPTLWLWVLMSCLPEVNPCLLCFGPPIQRARLCRDITGAFVDELRHKKCMEALVEAAKPLASVTVGTSIPKGIPTLNSIPEPSGFPISTKALTLTLTSRQREELREIVMDAMNSLEERWGKKSLNKSLQEAVSTIWRKLSQLSKVPACVPPCGFQPAARVFQCATCRLVDCQFALDCPVQDLWTYTDETIVLRCSVPFHIPPNLSVTWMFAPNLRTQDMALFKELKGNPEKPFSLTIEEPAPGTVACRLGEHSKPIIRKFFYLNVSEGSVEEEKGLQTLFTSVLHWNDETYTPIPALGLAVGFGSLACILLLVASWQCLYVRQTCRRRGHHGHQGTQEDSRLLDSV